MSEPVISIIIPTLGRKSLYPLVDNLLKQRIDYEYEIILIPQVKLDENVLEDKRIKLFYEEPGKGFAYYRNIGILNSKGKIIVFIDDDELPIDMLWLYNISKPIMEENEYVVTAGTMIQLKQDYLTDSISLLGFPGGGAVGFETMWPLKEKNYTEHLCSGNLAIKRDILIKIGMFSSELKNGNEDVNLADKLISNNIKIRYEKNATIYHLPRKGFLNFIKWNFLRGKSAAEYLQNSNEKGKGKVNNRIESSKRILSKTITTKYFLGIIFMMLNQYLWQGIGYIIGKCKK